MIKSFRNGQTVNTILCRICSSDKACPRYAKCPECLKKQAAQLKKRKPHQELAGFFEALHNNPPKPFNPSFNPKASEISREVVKSMEADGFYTRHSREECSLEYRKRYDSRLNGGQHAN